MCQSLVCIEKNLEVWVRTYLQESRTSPGLHICSGSTNVTNVALGERAKGGCSEPVISIKVNAAVLHETREGPEPIGEGQQLSMGPPRRVAFAGH